MTKKNYTQKFNWRKNRINKIKISFHVKLLIEKFQFLLSPEKPTFIMKIFYCGYFECTTLMNNFIQCVFLSMKVWENIFQIGVVLILRKFSIGSVWGLNTNIQMIFPIKIFPPLQIFRKFWKVVLVLVKMTKYQYRGANLNQIISKVCLCIGVIIFYQY